MSQPIRVKSILPVDPAPSTYNAFVASITHMNVSTIKVTGERTAGGNAANTKFELSSQYQIKPNKVLYRFDARGDIVDADKATLGNIETSVLVTFNTSIEQPDEACIKQFGATSAAMIAHPYLRESLSATALRIGIPGIVLPILTQEPVTNSD